MPLSGTVLRSYWSLLNLKEQLFAITPRKEAKSSKSIHEGEPKPIGNEYTMKDIPAVRFRSR